MRNTKYIFAALAAVTLALVSAAAYYIPRFQKEPVFSQSEQKTFFPEISESSFSDGGVTLMRRAAFFGDGGEFSVFRVFFKENTEYTYEIFLAGEDIVIRWQNYGGEQNEWSFAEIAELPKATLFIETSEENMILSVPALYYESAPHKTLEYLPEYEKAAVIAETDGGYTVRMSFEPQESTFGEFWYFKSGLKIIEWDSEQEALWIRQDLYKNRRFCYDGYYYKTYYNYVPYSDNGVFRNPANFTGAQIMKSPDSQSVNMGLAMTKICLLNQNEAGFWETGPKSEWLSSDYGIGYDFYDTRFSTDFARSLVYAYRVSEAEEFLDSGRKYADFLISYSDEYGYPVGAQKEGVLLPDYWGETMTKKPHVSLNHQMAEINFLLELYIATDSPKYKQYADKMLKGVELTLDEWLLEDGNLSYAVMHNEPDRQLNDYPFLTYNDLYDTRALLASLGEENAAVNLLMESKKDWMDKNGVTDYKK